MKSQPLNKQTPKRQTIVLNDKKPKIKPTPKVPPGVTLRTIHFIEVGDMPPQNIQFLVQELNATYNPAEQGIHFVIPVRNGKIGADIIFEEEFSNIKFVTRFIELIMFFLIISSNQFTSYISSLIFSGDQ